MRKSLFKIGAIGVFVVMVIGVLQSISFSATPNPVSTPNVLKDIEGHWAKTAIETSVAKGYVDGYEDNTFRPDQSVTRAEFVKMAVTALKLQVSGSVTGGEWYIPYANAAVNGGIHRWSDFNSGDWNTAMTRQEMARIAVRAAGEQTEDEKKWMFLAASKGLVQGLDDSGTLGEDMPTNRGQSVTIIERILTVRGGGTLPVDKHAVNRAEIVWHKTNIFTVMPKVVGGKMYSDGSKWDPNNLRLDTPDGLWSGELDALIAIDLEDPNDPHRSLLPPMSELKWFKSARFPNQMEEIMPAYILYFKSHVNWNYDPQLYVGSRLLHGILGVMNWGAPTDYNTLSTISTVYKDSFSDMPAFLIPKKLKTDGTFMLKIYDPIIAPNRPHSKAIHFVMAPELIE